LASRGGWRVCNKESGLKILIAIKCCHARQDFAEASRQTWIKKIPSGIDYRVFYGHGQHELKPDEVQLDVPDGYLDLCTKIHEMIRWTYDHGYDFLFQVDDDTYVLPDRLFLSDFRSHDFVGGESFGIDEYQRIFRYVGGVNASGPGFWLSRKSMEIVLRYPRPAHANPDEPWLGWVLRTNGTRVKQTPRLGCYGNIPKDGGHYEFVNCTLPEEKEIIAEWEYGPQEMLAIHREWESGTRRLPKPKQLEPNRKLDVTIAGVRLKNPA
jgi:hypothetical protein